MNYVILLKARNGEVATLPDFADDTLPSQTLLAGELLLRLGPYAPLIGKGKWVGSRVMALPLRGVVTPPAWREGDSTDVTHVVTRETELYLAEKFSDFHAVCNFSRGQYLLSPEPSSTWLGKTEMLIPTAMMTPREEVRRMLGFREAKRRVSFHSDTRRVCHVLRLQATPSTSRSRASSL